MDNRKQLIEFSRNWDLAMLTNNANEIGAFMSADWVIVGTEGGITSRAAFLESISMGDLVHTVMNADQLDVKIYDNSGIIIAKGTSSGYFKGKFFQLYEWSTSVFIREGDQWLCVVTMLTPAIKTQF